MAPLLDVAAPTFRRYADRHGYELRLDRSLDDTAAVADPRARARVRWEKVRLLRSLLPDHEVVFWLDADAVVCRDDRDVVEDLPPGRFQGLVLETFPDRTNPNTGVWVLRNVPAALRFLDAVLDVGQLEHSWADQAAVCHLLGWDLGDRHGHGARRARVSPFLAGTAWLPGEWNTVGGTAAVRPRVAHFPGLPLAERLAAMRRAAAVSARPGAPGTPPRGRRRAARGARRGRG